MIAQSLPTIPISYTLRFLTPCLSVPATASLGLARCSCSAPGGARSTHTAARAWKRRALLPQGPCQSHIRVHLLWGQLGRFGKGTNRVAELPLRQEVPPQPDQGLHQGRQEVLGGGASPSASFKRPTASRKPPVLSAAVAPPSKASSRSWVTSCLLASGARRNAVRKTGMALPHCPRLKYDRPRYR